MHSITYEDSRDSWCKILAVNMYHSEPFVRTLVTLHLFKYYSALAIALVSICGKGRHILLLVNLFDRHLLQDFCTIN